MSCKAIFFIHLNGERLELCSQVYDEFDDPYKALNLRARTQGEQIVSILKRENKGIDSTSLEILVGRYDPQLPLFSNLPPVAHPYWNAVASPETVVNLEVK